MRVMVTLQTLAPDTPADDIAAVVERDGACILRDAIGPAELARLDDELRPYVDATEPGRDSFTGFRTTRTGALVARSPACRDLVMDPVVRAVCDRVLLPNCERYQLHLGQVIRIMPGQEAQPIHRDRWVWGARLRGLEPQLNTIWALTDVHDRERRDPGRARLRRLARRPRGRAATRSPTPRWTPARCSSTPAPCSTAAAPTAPTATASA